MKKFRLLSMILGFVFISPSLYAHPPSEMKLNYDAKQKLLHIEIKHLSYNPREHHIRRLMIVKNDEQPLISYFSSQKPDGLSQDVTIDAKKGDIIYVKAYCSDSGTKEETLAIE